MAEIRRPGVYNAIVHKPAEGPGGFDQRDVAQLTWTGREWRGLPSRAAVESVAPEPFREICLAHLEPEPCPACAAYRAVGL